MNNVSANLQYLHYVDSATRLKMSIIRKLIDRKECFPSL